MSPDDYVNDPDPKMVDVPGTIDDVPIDLGADAEEPCEDETAELWRHQKPLIEEDEDDGLKLAGFPPEEIPDILEAMGDDADDPLPDAPSGISATGQWGAPEHGGFPERGE